MADIVKPRRNYDSPRRREQAAATRREILAAAQKLFEQQGYATTTMAAIAAEAGVALKTVYLGFETKSGVLRALWNLLLRGDDEDVPIAQRPLFRDVIDEADPERQLRLNARNSRIIKERTGAVWEVLRNAADGDADIAALWNRIQTEFRSTQGIIVKSVHDKKALKRGLGVDRATDIVWTLNQPNVWQLLVVERGWTPAQYERWLGDSFCAQLLRTPARGRAKS